jgi:hypothetical protein
MMCLSISDKTDHSSLALTELSSGDKIAVLVARMAQGWSDSICASTLLWQEHMTKLTQRD